MFPNPNTPRMKIYPMNWSSSTNFQTTYAASGANSATSPTTSYSSSDISATSSNATTVSSTNATQSSSSISVSASINTSGSTNTPFQTSIASTKSNMQPTLSSSGLTVAISPGNNTAPIYGSLPETTSALTDTFAPSANSVHSSDAAQASNTISSSVVAQPSLTSSMSVAPTQGASIVLNKHESHTGGIAGGIVGGLLLLLLATLLVLYRRRIVKKLGRARLPWRKSAHTAPSAEFMNHPVVLAQRRSSSALLRTASPFSYGHTGAATAPPLGKYPYADSYDGHTLDEAPPPFTTGKFTDPIVEKVSASAATHQRMLSADTMYYGHGAGDTSTLVDHEVGSPEEMSEVGHAV